MGEKVFTSTHNFKLAFVMLVVFFISSVSVAIAQEAGETVTDSGMSLGDIFEFFIAAGYIVGVFVLLPWVIYTNMKEGLGLIEEGNTAPPKSSLSKDERNSRAANILEEINNKLTHFEEEGEELVIITKGSQARFTRKGLAYIRNDLVPTEPDIIARTNELIGVYQNRSKRVFTGSYWIIGFAVALLVIFIYQTGISRFVIIQTLGIVFYILSSRTPLYVLEKRIKRFGSIGFGIIGSVLSGLFIGSGTKYYKVYSDGRKERDHETELTGGVIYFIIIVILGLFLAFMTPLLGIVNFLVNYMNNALIPRKPESWYEKNFLLAEPVIS